MRLSLQGEGVSRERALALFPMDPQRLARVFEVLAGAPTPPTRRWRAVRPAECAAAGLPARPTGWSVTCR